MSAYKKYRVKLRRGDVLEVKPEAEQIDGKVFWFREAFIIDKDDSAIYEGETAMWTRWGDRSYPDDAPIWIASGDLEEIHERL